MKAHEIIPGKLYISGHPGQSDDVVMTIRGLGITDVVCLVNEVALAVAEEYGERFHYEPSSDGKSLTKDKRDRWVRLADKVFGMINTGSRVLVHCNAGRNRSGLLAALVVMRYYRIDPRYAINAITYVRYLRPRAIANPAFEEFILDL